MCSGSRGRRMPNGRGSGFAQRDMASSLTVRRQPPSGELWLHGSSIGVVTFRVPCATAHLAASLCVHIFPVGLWVVLARKCAGPRQAGAVSSAGEGLCWESARKIGATLQKTDAVAVVPERLCTRYSQGVRGRRSSSVAAQQPLMVGRSAIKCPVCSRFRPKRTFRHPSQVGEPRAEARRGRALGHLERHGGDDPDSRPGPAPRPGGAPGEPCSCTTQQARF
jgi:hypothetical protein